MNINLKHIAIICAGTLLEVYDSYVFAFLMPEITRHFLPFTNNSQIFALITFSTIFIVRPISGVLWGLMGDSSGKAWVFRNAMLFMGIITLVIGCLPTYASIGIAAPILLLGLRIAQGISISGELSSAVVLCFEQSSPTQRYRNHGILYGLIFSGIVLASFIVMLISKFEKETIEAIWRLPFIFGGIFGIGVYLLRRRIQFPERKFQTSIVELFTVYLKPIIYSILANCFVNLCWFYFSNVNTVLKANSITNPNASVICGMITVISCIMSGYFISSLSKAKQLTLVVTASIIIYLAILLLSLVLTDYILIFFYAEAIISGLIFTTIPLLILSELPESYRNSIYTISVNTSTALIVGGLPFILTLIVNIPLGNYYLLLMGSIVIILSIIGKIKLQQTQYQL